MHASVDGHLGCLHIGDITNGVVLSIQVQVFLLGQIHGYKITGHIVGVCITPYEVPNLTVE